MSAKRTHCIHGREPHEEYILELIRTQVAFGLAYLEEARTAYLESRTEFAETAREIALNSYHSAVRFASRLAKGVDAALCDQLDRFQQEMQAVWPEAALSREIA